MATGKRMRAILSGMCVVALLCVMSTFVLTPAAADPADPVTPVTVSEVVEWKDGTNNYFRVVFDTTEAYFGDKKSFENLWFSGQWPENSEKLKTSVQEKLTIHVGDKSFPWGSTDNGNAFKLNLQKHSTTQKWMLYLYFNDTYATDNKIAEKDIAVTIEDGFQMPDGTPVESVTYARQEQGAWGDKDWAIKKSAAQLGAESITSLPAVTEGVTHVELPTIEGCTVAILSSDNEEVIALDGTVTPPEDNITVHLVLRVTDGEGKTADTGSIAVLVSPRPKTAAQAAAESITSVTAPETNATSLTLPTVEGCTVTIQSSDNEEVIALDGTIAPPKADTDVVLVLRVTDGDGNTADTASITVHVPRKVIGTGDSTDIIDVKWFNEFSESNFNMFMFQFDTNADFGDSGDKGSYTYEGLQYSSAWTDNIKDTAFRDSIANKLTIQWGDDKAKTIAEWGTVWHLCMYQSDGNNWKLRFHYRTKEDPAFTWYTKPITVAFLDGFTFPDGSKLNPMTFKREAAALGEGDWEIIAGSLTAKAIASGITSSTIVSPEKGATTFTMPEVPKGYTVQIASSEKEDILGLDGKINPPSKATYVGLVFTVTRLSDGSTADTDEVNVLVPAAVGASGDATTTKGDTDTTTQADVPAGSTTGASASDKDGEDGVETGESGVAVAAGLLALTAAGALGLSRRHR